MAYIAVESLIDDLLLLGVYRHTFSQSQTENNYNYRPVNIPTVSVLSSTSRHTGTPQKDTSQQKEDHDPSSHGRDHPPVHHLVSRYGLHGREGSGSLRSVGTRDGACTVTDLGAWNNRGGSDLLDRSGRRHAGTRSPVRTRGDGDKVLGEDEVGGTRIHELERHFRASGHVRGPDEVGRADAVEPPEDRHAACERDAEGVGREPACPRDVCGDTFDEGWEGAEDDELVGVHSSRCRVEWHRPYVVYSLAQRDLSTTRRHDCGVPRNMSEPG